MTSVLLRRICDLKRLTYFVMEGHVTESGIFKAAVKLLPDRRAAYLDQACGSDADLRGEIESLLHADDTSCGFLDVSALFL